MRGFDPHTARQINKYMLDENVMKQLHWFAIEGPRTALQLGKAMLELPYARDVAKGDGHPIIVMPGFGASNGSTFALRRTLNDHGHNTIKWDHGRNLGIDEQLITKLINQVHTEANRHGAKVSIIGQSLGGTIGRVVGRISSHNVRQVITLAAPINSLEGITDMIKDIYDSLLPGSTTADVAWDLYRNLVTMPLTIPCTSIYSKSDGVVPWTLSVQEDHEFAENVEVDCNHLGMGFNLDIIKIVADRLS